MSSSTLSLDQVAVFWRVARRLFTIYAELDRTFELGLPSSPDLERATDKPVPEALDRVRNWLDQVDARVQVWQLRQLLQSTNLQNEENLRFLVGRHMEKPAKTDSDKDKIDFLLVQYFAHCAPQGLNEAQTTLDEVAKVLAPAINASPDAFPDWAPGLDDKLEKLNQSNSLEELQNSGALLEVRELKLAMGEQYFEPGALVAFTRFNFLARRAFFRAMHLDLHAIRSAVNELEQMGVATVDCREAGLTEAESLDQVRHVVHQWKTPFRAPYSGGSSFLQLILLRFALNRTLEEARKNPPPKPVQAVPSPTANPATLPAREIPSTPQVDKAAIRAEFQVVRVEQADLHPHTATPEAAKGGPAAPTVEDRSDVISRSPSTAEQSAKEEPEEEIYLQRCVGDITEQLKAVPAKNSPGVSAIVLGGCKLLVATWEAQAFTNAEDAFAKAMKRAVAARTILHVCMERHKKGEPTDLAAALEIAKGQTSEIQAQVEIAKESKNIDAAVNLAATSKRLLSLIVDAEKVLGRAS